MVLRLQAFGGSWNKYEQTKNHRIIFRICLGSSQVVFWNLGFPFFFLLCKATPRGGILPKVPFCFWFRFNDLQEIHELHLDLHPKVRLTKDRMMSRCHVLDDGHIYIYIYSKVLKISYPWESWSYFSPHLGLFKLERRRQTQQQVAPPQDMAVAEERLTHGPFCWDQTSTLQKKEPFKKKKRETNPFCKRHLSVFFDGISWWHWG